MVGLPILIEIAVEAKLKADHGRLAEALLAFGAADPAVHVAIGAGSNQIVVGGASEHDLDRAIDALQRSHGIALTVGAPQVAYHEKLTKRIEKDYTHKKQTGGTGQFARVKIVFEPNDTGAGSAFESKIVGGAVPKEYIPGVEKGINSVMGAGVLAGFPVVDVKATLIDGAYHDVDSSVLAFEIASRAAFREALREGGSVLLEPIMKVEVTTPEDYTGFVMGDFSARRGQILRQETKGQDMRGNAVVINAMVPLANMFGYVDQLRSGTQGRANYTMVFSHYQAVDPIGQPDPPFRPAAALRAA